MSTCAVNKFHAGQWLEILSSILKLMDVQHEIVTGAGPLPLPLPLHHKPWNIFHPNHLLSASSRCVQGRLTKALCSKDKVYLHSTLPCTAEGLLRRGEDEGRIDFLSKVRNKALEPLWAAARPNMTSKGWPADRIIYMNDVFVCAKDFVRLMLHPADMVCALDFWQRNEVGSSSGVTFSYLLIASRVAV